MTTHGDIHKGNVVFEFSNNKKKANFIDLEDICTTSALHDINQCLFRSSGLTISQKKRFIKTYLQEFSESTDDESIESFLSDVIATKECHKKIWDTVK